MNVEEPGNQKNLATENQVSMDQNHSEAKKNRSEDATSLLS